MKDFRKILVELLEDYNIQTFLLWGIVLIISLILI